MAQSASLLTHASAGSRRFVSDRGGLATFHATFAALKSIIDPPRCALLAVEAAIALKAEGRLSP
jgi:hypothetical protein